MVIMTMVITGCQPKEGAPGAEGETVFDAKAPIEVWIDAAREESAGKFIDAFPEKGAMVTLTTTDYGQLPQKILFWNNVGGGWPDASFSGPQIVPLINDASHSYLGDLKPFVKEDIVKGFAEGSLTNCWDGEKLYCLRNDLAFFVMWYNAPKLKELGIAPPQTYEELMTICASVKQSNPEITCTLMQQQESYINILTSAQCPIQQILGPGKIRINAVHENCVKAAKWFDEMVSKGYFLATNMWAAETSDIVKSNNWLFMPSSSWFGDYVIRGTYYDADDPDFVGKIGVAPMPKWEGQDRPYVFWWGGAAWVMSRHTKNPQLTADFLVYMTTDVIKEQGTYPAYVPAAEEWLKNRMPTLTYLEDTTKAGEILKQESVHMWTVMSEAPVPIQDMLAPILAKINAGEINYEQALAEWQQAMLDSAAKLGYEVTTEGLDQ
jgi:ABC-type glycerol-3-phosphate transport system substrate-binding protein